MGLRRKFNSGFCEKKTKYNPKIPLTNAFKKIDIHQSFQKLTKITQKEQLKNQNNA